jgi:hypothetical protein
VQAAGRPTRFFVLSTNYCMYDCTTSTPEREGDAGYIVAPRGHCRRCDILGMGDGRPCCLYDVRAIGVCSTEGGGRRTRRARGRAVSSAYVQVCTRGRLNSRNSQNRVVGASTMHQRIEKRRALFLTSYHGGILLIT